MGARPQWFWGAEEQHMEALRRFELDLVIGGLNDRDPWKKKVGITRPYFEERVRVGVRRSADIEGKEHDPLADELQNAPARLDWVAGRACG